MMIERSAILAAAVLACAISSGAAVAADGAVSGAPPVDPSVKACGLLSPAEIETVVGAPAVIRESRDSGKGVSMCRWVGSNKDASVAVSFFPFASHGVSGATPLDYFEQSVGYYRETVKGQGEYAALQGDWAAAYGLKLSDNPTGFQQVFLLKAQDNVTLDATGASPEAAAALAKAIAARM